MLPLSEVGELFAEEGKYVELIWEVYGGLQSQWNSPTQVRDWIPKNILFCFKMACPLKMGKSPCSLLFIVNGNLAIPWWKGTKLSASTGDELVEGMENAFGFCSARDLLITFLKSFLPIPSSPLECWGPDRPPAPQMLGSRCAPFRKPCE